MPANGDADGTALSNIYMPRYLHLCVDVLDNIGNLNRNKLDRITLDPANYPFGSTFFNVAHSKYTNFGMQKFRLDYEGSRDLRLNEESVFKFKVKRYAELLMDTYLVVNLSDIWSPIRHPNVYTGNLWAPYDFRWIKNIGTHMIKMLFKLYSISLFIPHCESI